METSVRLAFTDDAELDSHEFAATMLAGLPASHHADCHEHVVAVLATIYPEFSREGLDVIVQAASAEVQEVQNEEDA